MNYHEEPLPTKQPPLSISTNLNQLLADEYILMNKTVSLLLGLAITPGKEMTEQVYDELKKNVKDITRFFVSNVQHRADISISNFLAHTRLQISAEINKLSAFKLLIYDHYFIIGEVDDTLRKFKYDEPEMCSMLHTIKQRHTSIATALAAYLKQHTQ